MAEIYEEVLDNAVTLEPIIEALNDKAHKKVVLLILGVSDESKASFEKAKPIIENKYAKKAILLWLKSVDKLPEFLKSELEPLANNILVGLKATREIAGTLKTNDILDEIRIDKLILKSIAKSTKSKS